MHVNTVGWNRVRYSVIAPLYDRFRFFTRQRQRSIGLLGLRPGERVLLVGAGPGHDLAFIPRENPVLVTDVAPGMIARARRRARPGATFAVMDGAHLDVAEETFAAAVLHLVLAVMPDPAGCVREVARALLPGGRAAILDKFLADGALLGWLRRAANVAATAVATDFNRRLGDILAEAATSLRIVHDEPAAFGDLFRIVILEKP
jgi:phosphatidylethanolamine/phosphatidyl-N-methylethanolamine N-methyltransferase